MGPKRLRNKNVNCQPVIIPNHVDRSDWPGWATVENDPSSFNYMLRGMGVSDAVIEEVFSLDEETVLQFSDCLGFIFLFPWLDDEKNDKEEITCPHNVYFANQTVQNACASVALLNLVFNSTLRTNRSISDFKTSTESFPPALRGEALANFDELRRLHNARARYSETRMSDLNLKDAFLLRNSSKSVKASDNAEDDDAYHFVCYTRIQNNLYELDGLRRQPVNLGTFTDNRSWITAALDIIKGKMESTGLAQYSLLALRPRISESERLLQRSFTILGSLLERLEDSDCDWKKANVSHEIREELAQVLREHRNQARSGTFEMDSNLSHNPAIHETEDISNSTALLATVLQQYQEHIGLWKSCLQEGTRLDVPQASFDYSPALEYFLRIIKLKSGMAMQGKPVSASC